MPAVRGRGATRSPANTAAMRRLERPRDRLRSRDAPRAEGPAPARIPGNPGTTERSQLHPRPTPRPDTPAIVRRHTPRSPPPPTTPPRRPPSRPIPERRRLHVHRAEVHAALAPMMDLVVDRVQDQPVDLVRVHVESRVHLLETLCRDLCPVRIDLLR